MKFVYTIGIYIATFILWIAQFFSKKMKKFVSGRSNVFDTLQKNIQASDTSIWFHCASLGEFEQGLPIMEALKKEAPNYKIIVSFFSPSGYEIRKNAAIADVVVYLPMDTPDNAKRFIKIAHPTMAIFIKYEFWPNYLFELQKQGIASFLISGLFRKEQLFFKSYGGFMRKALKTFNHILVQNEASERLLHSIGLPNVTVSGDTRFDRVSQQIEQNNELDFVSEFKNDALCVVCGSTWPEDEAVLLQYINNAPKNVKFIVAPHKLDSSKIETFRKNIQKKTILYSDRLKADLKDFEVFIIDTIGLLTKIYAYADIAYVGGAMGNTGLHNILEPATFGVPIVIGKNYSLFPEAVRLQHLAGLFTVRTPNECSEIITKLATDTNFRNKTGMIAEHFVNKNTGATKKTISVIKAHALLPS